MGCLKPTDYPIMEDLYNTAKRLAKDNEKDLRPAEQNYFKELAILLRNIAAGSDSFIWNTHSTVNPTSSFVVFDTSAINNTSDNVRKALYHTVLSYCKELLYRDRHERVILVCDEAHTAVDRRIPETVADFNRISRTVRKFESGLWICSHQLMDFLDPQIRKEGRRCWNSRISNCLCRWAKAGTWRISGTCTALPTRRKNVCWNSSAARACC